MKLKLVHLLYVLLLALLTACETVPTNTALDQSALCARGIVTSRQAVTALLRAGRITLEKDREIQAALDTAEPGCRALATGATGAKP